MIYGCSQPRELWFIDFNHVHVHVYILFSHVVDYCPLANLTVDAIQTNQTHSLELSSSSEDGYTMSVAEWIASVAGEEHAFLVTARGNAVAASGKQGGSSSETSYIFVVKSE